MLTRNESHQYFWGDRRVPGVSEILESSGLVDTRWFKDEDRIRGHYVHKACELHLEGDLYWPGLLDEYRPWVESFGLFVEAVRPKIVELETMRISKIYGFAGQLDWLLEINGQLWLIDGKSGTVAPIAALQTAAYEHLVDSPALIKRAALRLRKDGKQAIMVPFKDEQDWPDFVHLLGAFNAKLRLQGGWEKWDQRKEAA